MGTSADGAAHESLQHTSQMSRRCRDQTDAGWRPDPTGRYEWRYWDGGWTNRVASSAPGESGPDGRRPAPADPSRPSGPHSPDPAPAFTAPPSERVGARRAPAVAAGRPPVNAPKPKAALPAPEYPLPEHPPVPGGERRTGLWAVIVGCFRVVRRRAGVVPLRRARRHRPRSPRRAMLAATPANYGRAGLVALAACGRRGRVVPPLALGHDRRRSPSSAPDSRTGTAGRSPSARRGARAAPPCSASGCGRCAGSHMAIAVVARRPDRSATSCTSTTS